MKSVPPVGGAIKLVCLLGLQDYMAAEGQLLFGPGETQKLISVSLLELKEADSLMDRQLRQFVVDLRNPQQGAKLGHHPKTTVTITDTPGERGGA